MRHGTGGTGPGPVSAATAITGGRTTTPAIRGRSAASRRVTVLVRTPGSGAPVAAVAGPVVASSVEAGPTRRATRRAALGATITTRAAACTEAPPGVPAAGTDGVGRRTATGAASPRSCLGARRAAAASTSTPAPDVAAVFRAPPTPGRTGVYGSARAR